MPPAYRHTRSVNGFAVRRVALALRVTDTARDGCLKASGEGHQFSPLRRAFSHGLRPGSNKGHPEKMKELNSAALTNDETPGGGMTKLRTSNGRTSKPERIVSNIERLDGQGIMYKYVTVARLGPNRRIDPRSDGDAAFRRWFECRKVCFECRTGRLRKSKRLPRSDDPKVRNSNDLLFEFRAFGTVLPVNQFVKILDIRLRNGRG